MRARRSCSTAQRDVRDAVLAERERLATVSGVLDGAEVGYNMAWGGRDGLWPWRTGNDLALVEAERYAALAHWHGAAYPEAEMAALWRDHLTYQAHAQETAFAEDFNELRHLAQHVRYEAERTGRRARAVSRGQARRRRPLHPLRLQPSLLADERDHRRLPPMRHAHGRVGWRRG